MTFAKTSELIKLSSVDYIRFSDFAIYKKAMRLLQSEKLADEFMISKFGGYEKSDLNVIKRNLI